MQALVDLKETYYGYADWGWDCCYTDDLDKHPKLVAKRLRTVAERIEEGWKNPL